MYIVGKASTKESIGTFATVEEAKAFLQGIKWVYGVILSNDENCPLAIYTKWEWMRIHSNIGGKEGYEGI